MQKLMGLLLSMSLAAIVPTGFANADGTGGGRGGSSMSPSQQAKTDRNTHYDRTFGVGKGIDGKNRNIGPGGRSLGNRGATGGYGYGKGSTFGGRTGPSSGDR